MAVRYGTPQFLRRDAVRFFCDGTGTVRLFCNGTGTVPWYVVWIKIPDFSHIAPAFYMQKRKTAKAEVKCVNWDRWFIGKWFQSQLKLRVVKSKDGSTVRYVNIVWYASIFAKKYGTVERYAFFVMVRVRYASKIELKYGTVEGARYVVRKFWTYRTVLPSLLTTIVCSALLKLRLCKNLYSKIFLKSEICVRFSSNQLVVALYYFQFLVAEFVFAL